MLGTRPRFALLVVAGLFVSADRPLAQTLQSEWKFRRASEPVASQYLVVLKPGAVAVTPGGVTSLESDLTRLHGGSVFFRYEHALQGFAIRMTEAAALRLSEDPSVAWVEEDAVVHMAGTQLNPPAWGLDRIDQRNLPLNARYDYFPTGSGVHVYVIDSGIRVTHAEFGGRADGVFTAISDGNGTNDCNGHGTHVAAIVGGATFGVAKGVRLHALRVFDCFGYSTATAVTSAVDWVTAYRIAPAVVNMSLINNDISSTALDTAIQNSINTGITYVVAAGNYSADACTYSPGRVGPAITVGATTSADAVASYSNQGSCVDLFAPGSGILSAWIGSDTDTATMSGTSMASPHAAGVAALYLEANRSASPANVANVLVSQATANVLTGTTAGSPNLLLFENFVTCSSGVRCPNVDYCVFTQTDIKHCGSCGHQCPSGYECSGGTCIQGTVCPPGKWDCCGDGVCRYPALCEKIGC